MAEEYYGYQFETDVCCDIEQYEMLERCSAKKDTTEWNNWRQKNADAKINLQGAAFGEMKLRGVNLVFARLQGANLSYVELKGAFLIGANLQDAILGKAELQDAGLGGANLKDAFLGGANLQGAYLGRADLRGADFSESNLMGVNAEEAIVDGKTLIANCKINKDTIFTAVGLDAARIEPGLKQLLQYNIRRKQWEQWYKEKSFWRRPWKPLVWLFWKMSDYGKSTGRIIAWFFGLAAAFALLYFFVPGLVNKLHISGYWLKDMVRAFYFSIVTMTTLGFGDMHAYPYGWWGHILLTLQVLLGYIMLAALVTRFAVLFTAGGPAGSFYKPDKDDKKDKGESKS